jgi:phage/plasmid-associated DNA primase
LEKVVRDLFNYYNDNHVEFDTNIQLLPFLNGKCIDLFTFETRDITKDDYVINKLKYDWIAPSKEDMEEFNEHFNKIVEMPDDKVGVKRDILYMLTCGLFAHRVEYFFVLNGKGRNGKSLLMDWYNLALNGLIYNASPSTLYRDIDGGKPDPSVALIGDKRAVVFGEGRSNVKASQATIKMLVGDKDINARSCNSNKTQQRNIGTYIALCNEKPTIDGKMDSEGIGNKIRDIYFHNTFTPDSSKYNLPNHYPQNPKLKNPDYCNKMKYCLLNKLIQFAKKIKEETGEHIINTSWKFSKQVVEDSKAYIQDCDILLTTIKENYEITETEDDKVASEEIYERYIMNNKDIVNNPKIYPQYKGLSLRNFRKYLENDCEELKYKFKKNPTLVNGKTKRGVILCLKKKKEVEEEEHECKIDIDSDCD